MFGALDESTHGARGVEHEHHIRLRKLFPAGDQTRVTDFAPGFVLVVIGLGVGALLLRLPRPWTRGGAIAVAVGTLFGVFYTAFIGGESQRVALSNEAQAHFETSFSKTVGNALDEQLPSRSVILLETAILRRRLRITA